MQQPPRPPWVQDPGAHRLVTVIPTSVLKQRKPTMADVIGLTPWRWDEVKDSGQYQRVEIHTPIRQQPGTADVVDSGAVNIYIPGP